MTADEILKLTQKYIENKPTTILGSGASVAFGLPTMHDLAMAIRNYLSSKPELEAALDSFNRTYEDTENLEKTLEHLEQTAEDKIIRNIRMSIYKSVSQKDAMTLERILKNEIVLPHSKLFRYFLRATPCAIDVITTNYDCLAEYAINSIGVRYYDLFEAGLLSDFSPNFNRATLLKNERSLTFLHKVHGSINWFVDDLRNVHSISLREIASKVLQPVIITPGTIKYKTTWDDPYRAVIQSADDAINRASCFLCIGYGFNDEHIQHRVIRQIRSKKPIVIVTKKMTDSGNYIFSATGIEKYLIFEECTEGTIVRSSDLAAPYTLNGLRLWDFTEFANWLID